MLDFFKYKVFNNKKNSMLNIKNNNKCLQEQLRVNNTVLRVK